MEHKKINVLQLVEGLSYGGAEDKLVELINHMDSSRFNTIMCSLGLGDDIHDKVLKSGIQLVMMPRKNRFDMGLLLRLKKMMKENEIDIVMTTLFYADVMGAIAGRMAGVKAVFSWETISAPEWLIKRRLWPYQFAMRYCAKVVSVSKATAKFLIEERGVPAEKVMIIPYGVNLRHYIVGDGNAMRQRLGLNGKDFIIGMVARLHPQKGHQYLFEAARSIVAKYPHVKFLIVGEGEIRRELEESVQKMDLSSNVTFLGHRTDVNDLLKAFDVFTLPSLFEGLPNVVLEAMSAGKPVVATSVDGTVEAVVHGETGLLVPPKDPEKLKDAFIQLIEHKDQARDMGKKGRQRIENVFSLDKQVEAFQNLYEEYYQKANRKS
ncbi:MAG: glycosyltransferase [Candidatus Zhuqueibacterota bacterium]